MNNIEMLRWVLAGIGIFLVVLLYWFGRADKRNYRKRASHIHDNQSVEPYMSDEALSLDLDACQREEISREIQSSPIANGVFDKVDEFYDEVVDSKKSHDEVVVVSDTADLPSFSATSDPEPTVSIEKGKGNQQPEPGDVDALTNVPAWLQQSQQETDATVVPTKDNVEKANSRQSNTVGLFQNDVRNPVQAPKLPEVNSETNMKSATADSKTTQQPGTKPQSSTTAIPENYSEKIKQAVAAVTNIERSEEESVPENRNLFDKLPRSANSRVDTGVQKENVFANDQGVEAAKVTISEAEKEIANDLAQVVEPTSTSEVESAKIKNESAESLSTGQVDEASEQGQQQDINQTNVMLHNTEVADKAKSAAGGHAVFYSAAENESLSTSSSIESPEKYEQEKNESERNEQEKTKPANNESGNSEPANGELDKIDQKASKTEASESVAIEHEHSQEDKTETEQRNKLIDTEPVTDIDPGADSQATIDKDNTVVHIDPSRFRKSDSRKTPAETTVIDNAAESDGTEKHNQAEQEQTQDSVQDASEANLSETVGTAVNSASIQVVESKDNSALIDEQNDSNKVESLESSTTTEVDTQSNLSATKTTNDTGLDSQKKKRVNGFDRNNPDAELVSFYLVNKEKPYQADELIALATEHGLELSEDGNLYMAQDTGFAKDYVFSLSSIDVNYSINKNDVSGEGFVTICFRLLQGKEIVGRLNTLDSMLRLAKRIETDLGGALYDVGYCPITDLMISHLRRQIQENDVKNCQ